MNDGSATGEYRPISSICFELRAERASATTIR